MDFANTFLKLKDAPLNLAEISLGNRFEDSHGLHQLRNLNLSQEFVEAASKQPVSCPFFGAPASQLLRYASLDVEYQSVEETPVDFIVAM